MFRITIFFDRLGLFLKSMDCELHCGVFLEHRVFQKHLVHVWSHIKAAFHYYFKILKKNPNKTNSPLKPCFLLAHCFPCFGLQIIFNKD